MNFARAATAEVAPIAGDQFDKWVAQLRELHSRVPQDAPACQREVAELLSGLSSPHVDVAFVGSQKAGKSTLINGAMKRTILAVDDLPETGTVCRITAGLRDEAMVIDDSDGSVAERIPCEASAIRRFTALQPGDARRDDSEIPRHVHLTLCNVPIPPHVSWLDTPGTNDTAGMTERSREAASAADVLFFVSSSQQFLCENEATYLSDLVARNGPASVILVINAFLREPHPRAWERFRTEMLGRFLNKLDEWSPEMGFTEAAPLAALPICAEALALGDGELLGGRELLRALLGIRSPDHPRVRRTRIHRAAVELHRLAQQADGWRAALESQVTENDRRNATEAQLASSRRTAFLRQAEGLVAELVSTSSEAIRQAGNSVRQSVTAAWSDVTVAATSDYDRKLMTKIGSSVWGCVERFIQRVRDCAREQNQCQPAETLGTSVYQRILTHRFNVTGGRDISKVGEGSGLAGGAAAAAAAVVAAIATGGLSFGVVPMAGIAAAAYIREKAQSKAAGEARDSIRRSIDAETNQAVSAALNARDAVLRLVADACPPESVPEGASHSQRARLGELTKLVADTRALAQWGLQLAGARVSR